MDWNARIRAALTAAGVLPDDDVVEELAQHARAMYDRARAEGCSREQANGRVEEQIERWRLEAPELRHRSRRAPAVEPPPALAPWIASVAQDARYAWRLLWRQPAYALLVVVTMAVGIGSTTAVFSVTHGVLMKPLPWPDADRLVVLKETRGGHAPRFGSFSNTAYLAWRDHAATIEEIGAWSPHTLTLTGVGDPERIRVTVATASLFRARTGSSRWECEAR
jgi:hypothetical protein